MPNLTASLGARLERRTVELVGADDEVQMSAAVALPTAAVEVVVAADGTFAVYLHRGARGADWDDCTELLSGTLEVIAAA